MQEVTLTEAAEQAGRSYKTLHKHMKLGHLPARKSGHIWLVRPDDVRMMITLWSIQKRNRR